MVSLESCKKSLDNLYLSDFFGNVKDLVFNIWETKDEEDRIKQTKDLPFGTVFQLDSSYYINCSPSYNYFKNKKMSGGKTKSLKKKKYKLINQKTTLTNKNKIGGSRKECICPPESASPAPDTEEKSSSNQQIIKIDGNIKENLETQIKSIISDKKIVPINNNDPIDIKVMGDIFINKDRLESPFIISFPIEINSSESKETGSKYFLINQLMSNKPENKEGGYLKYYNNLLINKQGSKKKNINLRKKLKKNTHDKSLKLNNLTYSKTLPKHKIVNNKKNNKYYGGALEAEGAPAPVVGEGEEVGAPEKADAESKQTLQTKNMRLIENINQNLSNNEGYIIYSKISQEIYDNLRQIIDEQEVKNNINTSFENLDKLNKYLNQINNFINRLSEFGEFINNLEKDKNQYILLKQKEGSESEIDDLKKKLFISDNEFKQKKKEIILEFNKLTSEKKDGKEDKTFSTPQIFLDPDTIDLKSDNPEKKKQFLLFNLGIDGFQIVRIDSNQFNRIKKIRSDDQPRLISKISNILDSIKPDKNIKEMIPSPESNDKYIIQNINILIEDIRDLLNQNNKKANILIKKCPKITNAAEELVTEVTGIS